MKFRGKSNRSLDAKGRLMLPPDFREILLSRSGEGRLVLTTYDNCIVGFPLPDWLEFEEAVSNIKNPSKQLRNFRRLVVGGAEEMSIDAQGRIRLSKEQLDYAGIGMEAVLLGQGARFELWQPERLNEAISGDFDDVSEALQDRLNFIF